MSNFMENGNKDLQQYQGQGATASQLIEWLKAGTANIATLKATVATLITAVVTTLTASVANIASLLAIDYKVTVTDTTTHAQFTCNTTVIINKSTATTQTISTNNASTSGIVVTLINIGAGVATVDFDGTANDPTLNQGCAAKFVWTGAVWEPLTAISGSNANGSWIKFPDGTMEQWGNVATASLTSNGYGPYYIAYGGYITYPIQFVAIPSVSLTYFDNSYGTFSIRLQGVFVDSFQPSFLRFYNATNVENYSWHAIGKWK
jgi:hypothetical protein